jgi:hypothetical protein
VGRVRASAKAVGHAGATEGLGDAERALSRPQPPHQRPVKEYLATDDHLGFAQMMLGERSTVLSELLVRQVVNG